MQCASFLRQYARSIFAALLLLVGASAAYATDTYSPPNLNIPTVVIGGATYTNMVVTVAGIVSGPSGSSGNGSVDTYDPTTNQLTIPNVVVGANTFHNVVITVGTMVSVASVTGADSYSPPNLSISSVQVGAQIYSNVTVTVGAIDAVIGGMPAAVRDVYSGGQLTIPAAMVGGHVYTNAVITVGSIVGVGGVDVPNVVGLTQAAATTALAGAHLVPGTVSTASSSTVPAGEVISQNPAAGANAALGSAVALTVSTGSANVSVPNVVGLTQAAATTAITGAHLVLGSVTTASSSTVPSGDVISESPAAGTSVAQGSAVNITVSSGSGGGGGGVGGIGTAFAWVPFTAAPVPNKTPVGQNGLFVLPTNPLETTAANVQWVIPNTPVMTVGGAFVLKGLTAGSGFWPYAGFYAALDSNHVVEIYGVNLTNASAGVPTPVPVGNFVAKHLTSLSLVCDSTSEQTNALDATSWFLVLHLIASGSCDSSPVGDSWVVVTATSTTTVSIKTTQIDAFYNPSGLMTGMVLNDPATGNILLYANKSFTSPVTLFAGSTIDNTIHQQQGGFNGGNFGNGTVEYRQLGKGATSKVYRLDYTGASSLKAIPSYNPTGNDSLSEDSIFEGTVADGTNFYFTDTNFSTLTETLYQEALGAAGSTPPAPVLLYSASVTPGFSAVGSNGSVVVLETINTGTPQTSSLGTLPVGVANSTSLTPIGPPAGFPGIIAGTQMLSSSSTDFSHAALFINDGCTGSGCTPKTHPDSTGILTPSNTTLEALQTNSTFLIDENLLGGGTVLQIRGVTDTGTQTDGGGKVYGVPTGDNAGSYAGTVFESCLAFTSTTCTQTGDYVVPANNVLPAVIGLSSAGDALGLIYTNASGNNVFSGVIANLLQHQIGTISLNNTSVEFAF